MEKVLSAIQLCLAAHVLLEVLEKATTADLWLGLEKLYMTKSRQQDPSQRMFVYFFYGRRYSHLTSFDDFNSIIIDLESLDMKLKDEDKGILLVISLRASYKHFKENLLYNKNNTLSFEDVKTNLLSKEKFDLEARTEKGEGLSVRGESFNKGNISKSKFERRKSKKSCNYCRKSGHVICKCFQLKNKREKEKDNSHAHPHEPVKVTLVESEFDGNVLFATSTKKRSVSDWILDSKCTSYVS